MSRATGSVEGLYEGGGGGINRMSLDLHNFCLLDNLTGEALACDVIL